LNVSFPMESSSAKFAQPSEKAICHYFGNDYNIFQTN
jgi:hypothetical protein